MAIFTAIGALNIFFVNLGFSLAAAGVVSNLVIGAPVVGATLVVRGAA